MSNASSSQRWLAGRTIALTISEPDNIAALGLSIEHLNDAFAELARQLLALGASLLYGGDLRRGGYTEILFELVARYTLSRGSADAQLPAVIDMLPYPAHAELTKGELLAWESEFAELGQLVYLDPNGEPLTYEKRLGWLGQGGSLSTSDWASSLTAMRVLVSRSSDAKIALGGRREGYRGRMPGVLEEALISSQLRQPLYLIGGFGGVARDLAEYNTGVDLLPLADYQRFLPTNNGLRPEERHRLTVSPHVDEIVMLIVRGLRHVFAADRE